MEYKVVLLDSWSKEVIMDGAPVSYLGLKEVLKRFTSMNQAKYKAVIDQAWRNGSTTYIPHAHDENQYSVAIVRTLGPGNPDAVQAEPEENNHEHIYTRNGRRISQQCCRPEISDQDYDHIYTRRGRR